MDESCKLIGNSFANTIQVVVFILSLISLFIHKIFIENDFNNLYTRLKLCIYSKCCCVNTFKYSQNTPRKWNVWLMDNIKQGFSTLAGHFWAIYAAKLLTSNNNDECGWFLIQFLVDTLFAIVLSFLLSKLSIKIISLISKSFADKWLTIGNYYTTYYNYKYQIWLFQTVHWLVCNLLARIACTYFILGCYHYFENINVWFSNMWINNRDNELIVVSLIIPLIMNTIQLLIQNWFLRWKKTYSSQRLQNSKLLLSDI